MDNEKHVIKTGWNWGAFMFSVPFGVANYAWLCLLTLVPIISFIWMIVSGFKGAKWAWNSGKFNSAREFNAVMKSWNRAGIVSAIVLAIGICLWIVLGIQMFSELQQMQNLPLG